MCVLLVQTIPQYREGDRFPPTAIEVIKCPISRKILQHFNLVDQLNLWIFIGKGLSNSCTNPTDWQN